MDTRRVSVVAFTTGKGGAGKTSTSAIAAYHAAKAGLRVGYLDCDVKTPNLPQVLELNGEVDSWKERYVDRTDPANPVSYPFPFSHEGVRFPVFSSAFFYGSKVGILNRGQVVYQLVNEFVDEIAWPPLDVLIVDVDPSAGDSLIAIRDRFVRRAAVIIAENDPSTLSDCGRQVENLRRVKEQNGLGFDILGAVGFRVGYAGPEWAAEDEAILRAHATGWKVPYLGSLPMDPSFRKHPLRGVTTTGRQVGEALASVVGRWNGHV